MSETNLPKPVSAYVGLIVASLEEARAASHSTAGQVARLPLAAAGQLLSVREHYDDLARTGEGVLDLLVGMVRHRLAGGEDTTDWAGDDFSGARGKAQAAAAMYTEVAGQVTERLGGVAGKAASTVTSLRGTRPADTNGTVEPTEASLAEAIAQELSEKVVRPAGATLEAAADRVEQAADEVAPDDVEEVTVTVDAELDADAEVNVDVEPEPTPLQQIEQFEPPQELQAQAGAVVSHDELPLPDFDHMTAPQLRGRLRKLDRVALVQLLDYERAHANRLPIVLMLENRITKLVESGDASGAAQAEPAPETPKPSAKSGPARKPGPKQNPPSQGVPTNPRQPR